MRRAGLAALLLAAGGVAGPASAQTAVQLDELSVVGDAQTAVDAPFNGSGGPIGTVPSPRFDGPVSPMMRPAGEVETVIGRERIQTAPNTSIADILRDSPGITLKQGNGPRDISVSIRGSNARNVAGIRNIKVFDDGFPVTTAEGQSRLDNVDPHAYRAIDVFRGPQSALFGNYAIGGAVDFRTRRGGEINGVEYGVDAGSFGYLSNYATFGGVNGPFEYMLFTSDARANRFILNNAFDTQTVNFLGTYTPTPDDRFTLKVLHNTVFSEQPVRLSLNQYRINPYQVGCFTGAVATPGCGTLTLFANGAFGATVPTTALQAGAFRNDTRTVLGGRWEHDFDAQTLWRTQVTFDNRDVLQPFTATGSKGNYPSFNVLTDLTRKGDFLGLPAVGYVALEYSAIDYSVGFFNLTPLGGGTYGAQASQQDARQANLGGRARAEVEFAPGWVGVTGISAEETTLAGLNTTFAYSAAGRTATPARVDRSFLNVAPELSLVYRPNAEWQFLGRVAAGYATPAVANLFITSAGVPGNNTDLKSQENLGFDLAATWTPLPYLLFNVTGFYEFFRNEIITQSPGAGLLSYQFNAPASEHRGVEALARVDLPSGWNALVAYTFLDQFYTRYTEQLSAGTAANGVTRRFDRAGFAIPGVPFNALTARFGYEQLTGPFRGLGAYVEGVMQDAFFIDNANLVKVPAYGIVNANVHYVRDLPDSFVKRITVYAEARNVFDQKYVGSAGIVADTISAATGLLNGASAVRAATGSIYAGEPRGIYGGFRLSY